MCAYMYIYIHNIYVCLFVYIYMYIYVSYGKIYSMYHPKSNQHIGGLRIRNTVHFSKH